MIDTALREQIRRHWEQDEKLRPEHCEWSEKYYCWRIEQASHCAFPIQFAPYPIHDSTAASLITMAYLKRLAEFGCSPQMHLSLTINFRGDKWEFPVDHGWLAAAVTAYQAVKEKP